jgi:hypothetical protein
VTTRQEWSPAERFASGSAPKAHQTLGATRPSVEWQSVLCPVAFDVTSRSKQSNEWNDAYVLTTAEVPVERVRLPAGVVAVAEAEAEERDAHARPYWGAALVSEVAVEAELRRQDYKPVRQWWAY